MYQYTRRHFLHLCFRAMIFLGLGGLIPARMFPRAEASEVLPDGLHVPQDYLRSLPTKNLRQIITADPSKSCTIMWQSTELQKGARLEYRKHGARGAGWADISYEYFTLEDQQLFIYTAHLERLEPETRYDCRVVRDDAAGQWMSLQTAGYGNLQAIIVCDSQCSETYEDWETTIHAAARDFPKASFIADLGDITDNGQSAWHWKSWYSGIADLLPLYPFVPVMGNHECYSLEWKDCLPENYLHQFSLPTNGSKKFLGYYYSFSYGPAHFLVLNNNFQELDGLRPGLLDEQRTWMREDLSRDKHPWRIVLMHKDIHSYNEYNFYTKEIGGLNDIAHDFMPDFEALGIDLVLTGHMHTYRNRGHLYDFKPADHGPVYVLCGLSGNARYDVPLDLMFDKVSSPQPETDNYVILDASPKILRLRCFLPDGTLIDDMELSKESRKQ